MATLSLTLGTAVRAHALPASGSSRRVEMVGPDASLAFYSASDLVLELSNVTDGASTGGGITYPGGTVHRVRVGRGECGLGATASSQTIDLLQIDPGDVPAADYGPAQLYGSTLYDGARVSADADPSSLGITISEVDEEGYSEGWLELAFGATGATTGEHPDDGTTFVFSLRDAFDHMLVNGVVPGFASTCFGFDIDRSVPDNCVVGLGLMNAGSLASATEFFGARLTESSGVYDVDAYASVSAVSVSGPQSGDPRRMWMTLGAFNDAQLRSICAFGAPASGVIDNEAAQTGAFGITGLTHGCIWAGRLGTGAGSEVIRIRPWTHLLDTATIRRTIP